MLKWITRGVNLSNKQFKTIKRWRSDDALFSAKANQMVALGCSDQRALQKDHGFKLMIGQLMWHDLASQALAKLQTRKRAG